MTEKRTLNMKDFCARMQSEIKKTYGISVSREMLMGLYGLAFKVIKTAVIDRNEEIKIKNFGTFMKAQRKYRGRNCEPRLKLRANNR